MKINHFLHDLEAIATQVAVVDDYTYQVLDKKFPIAYQQSYTKWHQPLHHFGQNNGDVNQLKENLQQQLSQAIYGLFYCTGTTARAAAIPDQPIQAMPPAAEREKTIKLLSEANSTANGFDPFWVVYSIDNYGNAFASKNGTLRQLVANQWVFATPEETSLKIGSVVKLIVAKENTTVQPVFYHVRGSELVSQQAEFVRVYFSTTFEGALLLVREITTVFNKYRLPFLFKCLNHPDLFIRTDSAVLYLSKFDFHFARRLLQPILDQLAPHLKAEVPLFTQEIQPGVSFSEDPANGQSFGMSRCALVAEGLIAAYHKKVAPGATQLAEIEQVFAKNGIDIERIYLNPNSHFPYNLPTPAREQPRTND